MIDCQPQKWNLLKPSLNIRAFAQTLKRIIQSHENSIPNKSEDDRICMNGSNPTKGQVLANIKSWKRNLQGDDKPHQHADNPQMMVANAKFFTMRLS
jgi:hypothetical protein